jgi:hypothetical protein
MWGTLGLAIAAKLHRTAGASQPAAPAPKPEPPYGSGHFGRWTEDEFGLPAFEYTCNQTTDPRAATAIKAGILSPTEHIHQVGNDRITALASNNGSVRVRQDEGNPKILNDFDPETSQFGGGIGYLTDGREALSTYYDGSHPHFERIFGAGYYRKRVAGKSYSVDQVISAPFGDDPVLLSQVTITNHRDTAATVRWVEYWGCQPYQLSFRDFIESAAGMGTEAELRHKLGRRFTHQISALESQQGLLESKKFLGRAAEEEARWQGIKAHLKAEPSQFLAPLPDERPGTYLDGGDIPQTFLVSLDGPASGLSCDADAFFGVGGVTDPTGLKSPLGTSPEESSLHSGLFLERTVQIPAKRTQTIHFLYGYLPESVSLDALVTKYRSAPAEALKQSSGEWKRHGMRFEVDAEPWVKRETAWNYYYLRSSQTYDDFFGEHILNQNGFYQYVMGFQGAARDPLQHCLPFLLSDPEIVRSILRYTLKEVRDDGSVPYGIVGHGVIAPIVTDNASDLPLWLLWTASEYVLATRDKDFLDETIPARFSAQAGRTDTVRNLLARCYRHQVNDVGVGKHGIVRMLNDDWNDGLLGTWSQAAFKECAEQGESVLNSAMTAWVFDEYARLLRYAGENSGLNEKVSESAETARTAARAQWTGKWLRRAWLGPTLGWLGEETLWIEPQPWAMVAGVTSPAQSRELVKTMDALLRRGPIGAAQMSEGPDLTKPGLFPQGTCVRGGVWPSLNQTLIWSLAQVDPAMAWDEWKKNSFARHAHAYPDVWYGVWSGTDSYNSLLSKNPGETVNDPVFPGAEFPVLNLHAHACSLYSITKVLNVEFTEEGVTLSPDLPVESYRLDSSLLGIAKKAAGRYEGWYAPSQPGNWTLTIKLPEQVAKGLSHAVVNGVAKPLKKLAGGKVVLTGSSELHKPLRWALS